MEFPNLGKHCRKEYCNKLDFLPIFCDGCKEIFCSEHYSYVNHDCSKIPEHRRDHQVPICPVCMAPVPSVKGQEDRAVSLHIDSDCKQETRIYTNSCSFGKCKKRELIPFNCTSCKMNFCLKHRHFDVHDCKGPKTTHQRDVLAQAAMSRNNPVSQDNFKKVQGAMSEDEALARAIQASIQETPSQISVGGGQSTSHDKNKCAIS